MCEWLSKRDRRGVLPRHDVIEIVDLDLVAVDEASIVVRNGFSGTWSGVGELLNALPAKCLMHWAKLRDLEISVRGGHAANAAPTMVAFRDFLDALRALRLAPYYEDRRQKYLASVRNEIHRVIEVELPRLGIAPGHGPLAAADEAALDDFGTSLGAGDLP